MSDRRRAMGVCGLCGAVATLLCVSLSALACTSDRKSDAPPGASGGSSAGLGASGGGAGAAGGPSGAGGASGSGAGSSAPDSTVPSEPKDGGVSPVDAAADSTPPGPIDAAEPPPDAAVEAGPPAPGCPPELPPFDYPCNRDGLTCTYGMECCPDLAFCEYGRWTLLTHHCDACI